LSNFQQFLVAEHILTVNSDEMARRRQPAYVISSIERRF